jgi:hypothetical protein
MFNFGDPDLIAQIDRHLAFKLKAGTDALLEAMDRARITDVVSRDRRSALTSGKRHAWWPFGSR